MFGGFQRGWSDADERRYQLEQLAREKEHQKRVKTLQRQHDAIEQIQNPAAYLNARRELYYCGDRFYTLDELPAWTQQLTKLRPPRVAPAATPQTMTSMGGPPRGSMSGSSWGRPSFSAAPGESVREVDRLVRFPVNGTLNDKVSLFQGDITTLEIDAIVNAANSSLRGGGGIDGAIHNAAGDLLYEECVTLNGCPTGNTKITKGYDLPAQYVLHTVGPMNGGDTALEHCYLSALDHILASHGVPTAGDATIDASQRVVPSFSRQGSALKDTIETISAYDPTTFSYRTPIRTLGICCISTGIYSFPRVRATHIALRTVRRWLEAHHQLVDRIIFVVFGNVDLDVYEALMPSYFPGHIAEGQALCPEDQQFPYDAPPAPPVAAAVKSTTSLETQREADDAVQATQDAASTLEVTKFVTVEEAPAGAEKHPSETELPAVSEEKVIASDAAEESIIATGATEEESIATADEGKIIASDATEEGIIASATQEEPTTTGVEEPEAKAEELPDRAVEQQRDVFFEDDDVD